MDCKHGYVLGLHYYSRLHDTTTIVCKYDGYYYVDELDSLLMDVPNMVTFGVYLMDCDSQRFVYWICPRLVTQLHGLYSYFVDLFCLLAFILFGSRHGPMF